MCCIHTYTETYKCAYVCHYTTTHTVCISPYLLDTQSWPDTGVLSAACIQKVTGDQPSAPPHCAFQNRPSTETLDLLIPLWAPAPPIAQLRRVHFHLLSGKSAPPQILEYEETLWPQDNHFMGTPRCHSRSTWKGGRGVEGMGGGTCWGWGGLGTSQVPLGSGLLRICPTIGTGLELAESEAIPCLHSARSPLGSMTGQVAQRVTPGRVGPGGTWLGPSFACRGLSGVECEPHRLTRVPPAPFPVLPCSDQLGLPLPQGSRIRDALDPRLHPE